MKDGNNRKRLQLRLDVPGYLPEDADRLAENLAGPDDEPQVLQAAAELLRPLIGEEIPGNREVAACPLCGHEYPMGFPVAAHAKKRSLCSDEERRDLRHVAVLARAFGCDALYEEGCLVRCGSGCVTAPCVGRPGCGPCPGWSGCCEHREWLAALGALLSPVVEQWLGSRARDLGSGTSRTSTTCQASWQQVVCKQAGGGLAAARSLPRFGTSPDRTALSTRSLLFPIGESPPQARKAATCRMANAWSMTY